MSTTDITILMDMGFSKVKIEEAIKATGDKGVESTMEWLLAHPDNQDFSAEFRLARSSRNTHTQGELHDANACTNVDIVIEEKKFIKCDICNKYFKTNFEIEFHASKSGHNKFSESNSDKKILTEEEKKQQLFILENKLKQKRKDREEQEKKEALKKEKNRIRSGKELAEAKRKLEELEMKKILEQRKQEKEENRLIRLEIKKQIEADKIARKTSMNNQDNSVASSSNLLSVITSENENSKDYSQTKLQIRLTNGQTLTQTFGSKEQLSAVRLYIEMNRNDKPESFSLMTNFPKRIFSDDDFETPLDALGLVPSAVIIVQKKNI